MTKSRKIDSVKLEAEPPKSKSLLSKNGRLVVPRALITDALQVSPGIVKALFSRFFPVYSEIVGFYPKEMIIYYGYSEEFEDIGENPVGPDYEVIVTDKRQSAKAAPVWSVSFQKISK